MAAFLIREMTGADVDSAVELLHTGGWDQRRPFLELMLATSNCHPLVGTIDGNVVATGQGVANGSVGWVGSIFVDARLRRQGLGRAMTEQVCRGLESAGCRTLGLIASDLGRPIYEKMGFRIDAMYQIHAAAPLHAAPTPPPGAAFRRMRSADLDRAGALDSLATGEDRRALLGALVDQGWLLETDDGEELLGFLVSIQPESAALVAPEPQDAACLLDLLRHLAESRTPAVRAAVVSGHTAGLRLLEAHGWTRAFETPRMLRGPAPAWSPTLIWSLLGFAFG
jgi:GNAT superfamily N-acetyltransferase